MQVLASAITGHSGRNKPPPGGTTFNLDKYQVLYIEGDPADYFYRLKSGIISEYRMLLNGKRQLVAIHFPGDLVGVTPSETHGSTTEATDCATVEVIPRGCLNHRLEDDEELKDQIVAQFLNGRIQAQAHLVLISRLSAIERVASFVLEFHKRQYRDDGNEHVIFIPLRRADIADYLGLTLETVSRCFSNLRARKLIDLPQSNVVHILDGAALAEVAYGDNGLRDWLCNA